MSAAPQHLLLYDRECGFCRWSVGRTLRWDRRRRLRPLALQEPAAAELLGHLTPEERMASFHLVAPDGAVMSAGEAAPELFALLPGGRPLATLARRLPGFSEGVYRFVADNRARFGRLVGASARRRADALIAAREGAPGGVSVDGGT